MPRVKKPAKVKEPVRLRMKELANGLKVPEGKWAKEIRACIWIYTGMANGHTSI